MNILQRTVWAVKAIVVLPSYLYNIILKVRLSKEVRDFKKLVNAHKHGSDARFQKLRVRHTMYSRFVGDRGLVHELGIYDQHGCLGTLRITIDATRPNRDSPVMVYTRAYFAQNTGEPFQRCADFNDAIQSLNHVKLPKQ